MTDYRNSSHNLFGSITVMPTQKLSLTTSFTYNQSSGGYDEVVMPSVEHLAVNDLGDPELTHQDFFFDEMHTYSDLNYKLSILAVRAAYRVSPSMMLTADFDYAELTDAAAWVYGSETGSLTGIRTGVEISF